MAVMKSIILIFIILLPLAMTCKPRRNNSGLSADEKNAIMVKKVAFAVGMRRKIRREPSLHFADETASLIMEELLKNIDSSSHHAVRYQSASAIADIAAVAPSWTFVEPGKSQNNSDPNPKVPTSDFVYRAIKTFQLKTPVGRKCRSKFSSSGSYKFQICSDYIQCAQAVTLLTSFSRRNWGDDRILDELRRRNDILAKDIDYMGCTDGPTHQAILKHKHESMKIWQEFNLASGIEFPSRLGQRPKMAENKLRELKTRLDNLNSYTEQKLLHQEIDKAVPADIMKQFILDEILSEQLLPQTSEIKPQPPGVAAPTNFDLHWAQLTAEQQDTVLAYFDLSYGSILQTHDANLRLRIYLDRINKKSIRPWLNCLNNRVDSYIKQYDQTKPRQIIRNVLATDGANDNNCIRRAIKPSIAFRALTAFSRQEMMLPERADYFRSGIELVGRKLIGNTRGIWKPQDEGFDPVSQATQIAADMMHTTNSMNANMYQVLYANNPDFFPPPNRAMPSETQTMESSANLRRAYEPTNSRHPVLGTDPQGVTYEQRMSQHLSGFHSLFYQLYQYQDRMDSMGRAYTIQRCIIGDNSLEAAQKEMCARSGRYNTQEAKPMKKTGEQWIDFTVEEKREALQKMNNLSTEMQVQTAKLACSLKQFASPSSFPDRINLTGREKQLSDKLADYLGFEAYGCWGPVVYNLNLRPLAYVLHGPFTMMGEAYKSISNRTAPSAHELKKPLDYATEPLDKIYQRLGSRWNEVGKGLESANVDHFFKEIPFKPAKDGYFDMNQICLAKGLRGQSPPSIFNYELSVNRWLTAQKVWDKCNEVSMELVSLVLSSVTLPAVGKLTHVIIGRLLIKSPAVLAAASKTIPGLARAANTSRASLLNFLATNPVALRTVTMMLLKNLPAAGWNLGWNILVFTALNKTLYRALFIQKLWDPRMTLWQNVGHELYMGAWFMGGMPLLHKFANIVFPGPISKFMGTGPSAAMANFSAGVATETTFFRYIGPVGESAVEWVEREYHRLVHGEYPPEKADEKWMHDKGELYEWGHALMMTLVFKVRLGGNTIMGENQQTLYNAHMSRIKTRYYRARQALKLPALEAYNKETFLAQNPYSDLFIDLSRVNYKNHAEVIKLAEANYDAVLSGKLKTPYGGNLGERAQQGDPIAKTVVTNMAHALETLRHPQVKARIDHMLQSALRGGSIQDFSNGQQGSIYRTPLEHYRVLEIEYRPGQTLNAATLNGKYKLRIREVNAEIDRQTGLMNRYSATSAKRKSYEQRIEDLKSLKNRIDTSYELLRDPTKRAEINQLIEDPRMAQAMEQQSMQQAADGAYLFE